MTYSWVLVLSLLGASAQSGKALVQIPMENEAVCKTAAAKWLSELPRDETGKFYKGHGPVSAICLPNSTKK